MSDTRGRVLQAAATLLAEGGSEAVSTRAVSALAGVQAPTLYRLFGDKQGMLDALATYGFDRYLASKGDHTGTGDPVQELRTGWDLHVEFGLTHPALYTLMYGTVSPGRRPAAADDALRGLEKVLEQVAAAGVLRVPVEIATNMILATAVGVTLTLITSPAEARDIRLSAATRDAVLAAVTIAKESVPRSDGDATLAARALALDAALPKDADILSPAELSLLREWMRRLACRGQHQND